MTGKSTFYVKISLLDWDDQKFSWIFYSPNPKCVAPLIRTVYRVGNINKTKFRHNATPSGKIMH